MMRGRADYLELGDWNCVCYMCGRKRKASTMVRNWQGFYNCPEHNEPRQPQDFVRSVPDVQTPPWTQPMPGNAYAKDFINISTSDLTAGDYTVTYTSGDGPASGGAVTVIVTIQQGVTIGTLTIDNTWPAGTTILINNYGTVNGVTNNSGITPTVNNLGYYASGQFVIDSVLLQSGPDIYGYSDGTSMPAGGTISASTLYGATITRIYCFAAPGSFWIELAGTLTQSFFTSVIINGSTLLTADATFSPDVGPPEITGWGWGPEQFTTGTVSLVIV